MLLTKLYISPHFDDAVFSCAGKIIDDVRNGHRVIVATVFSEGDSALYKERNQENNNALEILKAEGISLGFKDAPYRHEYYNSFRRIILERHSADNSDFVASIGKSLTDLCDSIKPSMVYAPIAIGTHIDHRLCFEAALDCIKYPIRFYEDRPYCFATYAVEARLQTIGIKLIPNSSDYLPMSQSSISDYLSSLDDQKYVNEYLPPSKERDDCYEIISLQLNIPETIQYLGTPIHFYHEGDIEIAHSAISAYRSQIPSFLGSVEQFQKEAMVYSMFMTQAISTYSEQYWNLSVKE